MQSRLIFKTQLRTAPQLIMMSKLLQLPASEIEQAILQEIVHNPALELAGDLPVWSQQLPQNHLKTQSSDIQMRELEPLNTWQGIEQEGDDPLERIPLQVPTLEQLANQARLLIDPCHMDIATLLLHSLDGHGYIRKSIESVATELDASPTLVEQVLIQLHQLEPHGICARNLQECLSIQCGYLDSTDAHCRLAQLLVQESWDDFYQQRWGRIKRKLGVTQLDIEAARQLIASHCYPYPMFLLEDGTTAEALLHRPDIIIYPKTTANSREFSIEIPASKSFTLQICSSFEEALQPDYKRSLSEEEFTWINKSVEQARLFIAALNQRWATLHRISQYLVAYQSDFLERGPLYLKPLTRAAVAGELGLHQSTIGRAIGNKVAQLPNGRLLPLTHFFDDSLAIKEAIQQLLSNSTTPLSDREIRSKLEAKGVLLARRTVAKYRKQLNILPVYQR